MGARQMEWAGHDGGVVMMRLLVVVLFGLGMGGLGAQTRLAGVRVTDAFQASVRAKKALDEIEQRRKALADDPRNKEIDAMVAEIRKLQEAAASSGDPQGRDKAVRAVEIKRGELEATGRLIEEDRVKGERELNRELVERTEEALGAIREAATVLGRERGFDLVLDTSGNSNTGVPVLLYSKKIPDLTAEVIARINQGQVAEPGPGAKPAGEGKPAPGEPLPPAPGKEG